MSRFVGRLKNIVLQALKTVLGRHYAKVRSKAKSLLQMAGVYGPQDIREKPSSPVLDAEGAVRSGFASGATRLLEEVVDSERSRLDRASAQWILAQHAVSIGDYGRSLGFLKDLHAINQKSLWKRPQRLLEIEALVQTGDYLGAQQAIEDLASHFPGTPEVRLHSANLAGRQGGTDAERLAHLNRLFIDSGFAPLEKRDAGHPLVLTNIVASADPERDCAAKLSVLMPAFNNAPMIEMAIRSVLAQTWHNLELIVVDDCSRDDTGEIVRRLANQDSRIRLVRQERNQGAYAARNRALALATGAFVTVHDADDWSHPQKFAVQLRHALENPSARLNATYGVRISRDLHVRTKPFGANQIVLNTSSLLFSREQLVELGGWNEVRMAADAELMDRLTIRDGPPERLHRSVPFSFILLDDASLTRDSRTGVNTILYGARREYRDSYRQWHARTDDFKLRGRPFPVPAVFLPDRPEKIELDILLVSDFALSGGTTSSNLGMLDAAKSLGLKIGVHHWPRLDNATRKKTERIDAYLYDNAIQRIVSGDTVRADLVIVNHPNLLSEIPDWRPSITTDHCVVVFNQAPITRLQGGRKAYDTRTVLENAEAVFGVRPVLAPLSGLIRGILAQEASQYRLTEANWFPLLMHLPAEIPVQRNGGKAMPTIGRHARDHIDKWPSDAAAIEKAYLAGTSIPVRILGGAQVAEDRLGYRPKNWDVLAFGSMPVEEFLATLDVYVYFPHEEIIEAFGRGPMEALAAGVPAILPLALKPIFGDAAIYTAPSDLSQTLMGLWSDPHAYRRQVERGLEFVKDHCDPALFGNRVRPFLNVDFGSNHG